MITSTQNSKVKWVRSLLNSRRARRESRAFVVEGVRLVEEAVIACLDALLVIYSDDLGERGQQVIERFADSGIPTEEVSPQVMRVISDTQTPQGILAVLSMRALPLPKNLDFVFIADGIRDPGNLGTMLRTASSAGVDGVFLSPESVDPYAPKVVRAAMGAHFRLPIDCLLWSDIQKHVYKNNLCVFLAETEKGDLYNRVDFVRPVAIIVGGEAEGHSREAQELADEWVNIPMPGGGESLNAAVAAAILMYEVVRQRNLS